MKNTVLCSILKLIFILIVNSAIGFFIGCANVFSSILFVQLQEPTSPIKLNEDEKSWIASIPSLVSPIGFLIIGILSDKIGRRKSIQIAFIPIILSWLVLAFANSYETILVGRIIAGLIFGSAACDFIYLAEVSQPRLRQLSFSVAISFVGVGMMTESAMSMSVHWHTISATFAAIGTVSCASLFALPESPAWLRARGRVAEAEHAARWFGLEVAEAPATAAADGQDAGRPETAAATPPWWWPYTRRTVWVPALCTLGFFVCQQGSGLYAMVFYTADVLRDFNVRWDGTVVTLFVSVSRLLGSVTYSLLYDVKRKTMAVTSCAGMAASLVVVVGYAKVFENVERPPWDFVPVAGFVAYMFFAMMGLMPLPWTLCGEVFPTAVSGTVNGIVQTIAFLMMFIATKVYPSMVSKLGIEDVWLIFCLVCITSVFFSIFILPETKGVPLKDILASFEKKSHKKIVKNHNIIV